MRADFLRASLSMLVDSIYRNAPGWAQSLLLNAHAYRIERHRYGAPYRAAVQRLLLQERWSRQQLQDYQSQRLRALVELAYSKSSYYRTVFDRCGLHPTQIRGIEDLDRLPILSKETVREHGAELLTSPKPLPGWLHGHTSGTTGSPLSLWYDRNTCVINNAVDRRQKIWGGMGENDWIGVLLGRTIVPPARKRPPFWRVNRVQRQVWFSSFHLNPVNLERYVAEIRRRGLRFLEGYPSTLFVLAKYLRDRGLVLPMRAVFTSSETLHELQRKTIEAAFECRLFDFYGLAERVIFATECEVHDGKHLAEEYGITEIVDANNRPVPDGEFGYLVGTSLHNTALPMIRYRTGDISAIRAQRCSCGRTLRRIESISTKAEDIVVTPDGRLISPSVLTHPFKPFDQILESQIVQERLDQVVIKIVSSASFTEQHEQALRASVHERLGAGMGIQIIHVDAIPREPSGKFRWIVSRVDHTCRLTWENLKS